MSAREGPLARFSLVGLLAALATFACSALTPGATATPTGVIGAIEAPTSADRADLQVWTGSITSQSSRQYLEGGALKMCSSTWISTLDFTVDAAGRLSGTGAATLSAWQCTPGASVVANAQSAAFALGGLKTPSGFNLQLGTPQYQPSSAPEEGGFILLFATDPCAFSPRTLPIQLSDASTAAAEFNFSGSLATCPGPSSRDTVSNQSVARLQYRFKCSQMPADINDPTIDQLCK